MNEKDRREETEGLDDILDEILQKNMEEEVRKDEPVREEALPEIEEVNLEDEAGEAAEDASDRKLSPEEYLDRVFSEEEGDKPGEPSDDMRVIEMESDSEESGGITKKDILSMLGYVLIVFLLTFVIVHFVGQRTRVSGSSMENTLSNGDNLIVDKLSYRFGDPERFDVIIFPYQYEEDTYYIKRIIGLPNETVQITPDGTIYIDGEVLDEDYGLETIADPGMAIEPVVLGEDEYFVLGDNRNNSSDSRFSGVGKVKREDIIGRAWIRIYPFSKIRKL